MDPLELTQNQRFARQFGQGALDGAPKSYRLLAISPQGGVAIELPWEAMREKADALSIHEDAFAWAAMNGSVNDVHASLLSCAMFAATRAYGACLSEHPRPLYRGMFDPFRGQGEQGVFEAAARFTGDPKELAEGFARLFPQAAICMAPSALCEAAFPKKLDSPAPDLWRALIEAAQLGQQAAPARSAPRARV